MKKANLSREISENTNITKFHHIQIMIVKGTHLGVSGSDDLGREVVGEANHEAAEASSQWKLPL